MDPAPSTHLPRVTRLVGVYRAEGSLSGEIAYVVGKLLGRAHCSLCDITHSPIRRKAAWDRMADRPRGAVRARAPRRARPRDAALVTGWDDSPAVLAEVDGTLRVVLGPDDLEPIGGDVDRFATALRAALNRLALTLPS